MTYGVTEEGFVVKRLEECKTELETEYLGSFEDIDLEDGSPFNQLISIMAKREADLWEVAEAIFLSQFPSSAEGIALDGAVQYNGLSRLPATSTLVNVLVKGIPETIIDTFFQCSIPSIGQAFRPIADSKIDALKTNQVQISLFSVEDNTEYSLYIDNTLIRITSGVSDTAIDILNALMVEIIDNDFTLLTCSVNEEDETLLIICNDVNDTVVFNVDESLIIINWLGSNIPFQSTVKGAINAPVNSIKKIDTPYTGIEEVINLSAGTPGRAIEDDVTLRLRRKTSIRGQGKATLDAIATRLISEVSNVIGAKVFENDDVVTDELGRPPKSIECVVFGGLDQDIANKIWELKAGGIYAYGNVSVDVVDSQGYHHTVRFSRATPKYIWIKVTVTLDEESDFPSDGEVQLKSAILSYCSVFTLGKDIIRQKLFTPVYGVSGISSAIIEIASTNAIDDTPTYAEQNITINEVSQSVFDLNRITIVFAE